MSASAGSVDSPVAVSVSTDGVRGTHSGCNDCGIVKLSTTGERCSEDLRVDVSEIADGGGGGIGIFWFIDGSCV